MDEDAREVRRGGELIELTATEFELLRFLMRNPRRVLSKAQILDRVWNYDFGGQAHVVELYISYLRKKIDAGREPLIHTVRGVGYVLKPGQLMSQRDGGQAGPRPDPDACARLARRAHAALAPDHRAGGAARRGLRGGRPRHLRGAEPHAPQPGGRPAAGRGRALCQLHGDERRDRAAQEDERPAADR